MTPTLLRPLAEADLVQRTRYYRREGGDSLAERFFDAAITTLEIAILRAAADGE